VKQLEGNTDLAPGDAALTHLKGILLRRIAELEVAEADPVSDVKTNPLSVLGTGVSKDRSASLRAEVVYQDDTHTGTRKPPDKAA
jgi:hypothetical protein